jgi:hypothetical protein
VQETLARIDTLLRGGFTERGQLRAGRVEVSVQGLAVAALPLGVVYGLFMGLYAVVRGGAWSGLQLLATALKVPLLFLLTLVVTLPSLYVLSALARSRLSYTHTVRLLLAAVTVNLALLASFGPVTAFFTLSTESYPFMILLNVAFFTVSGLVGLKFLRTSLDIVFEAEPDEPAPVPPTQAPSPRPPAANLPPLPPLGPRRHDPAARVFRTWTLIYAVVGAQMGWILRPFIGAPSEPFQWFRERQSNFFVVVWESFLRLF